MKVFRIFLSSTFLDFKNERHLLHTQVFKDLEKKFARSGVELEVIDLRWGVNETDARTQDTLELCLDEILRCQRLTEKPNFLGLMGGRVGWRPLPNMLGQTLYHALYVRGDDTAKRALEAWYRPDSTVLSDNDRVCDSLLVEQGEPVHMLAAETDANTRQWGIDQNILRTLIDDYGAEVPSPEEKRFALCASATFREVMTALHVVKNPIVLLRHGFCMQPGNDDNSRMERMLSADMRDILQDYYAEDDHQEDFAGYLEFDTGFVFERLSAHVKELLDERISQPDAHRFFGEHRCPPLYSLPGDDAFIFQGRGPTLDRLQALFVADREKSAFQVVTGCGGAGKTALLAALVARLRRAAEKMTPRPVIFEYYVGATPDSLRADNLERSVSALLSRTDLTRLWLVIDGLDHLGPHSIARLCSVIERTAAIPMERAKEKRQFVLCAGIRSEDGTPPDPDWSAPVQLPTRDWWPGDTRETPPLRLSASDPDAPVAHKLLDTLTATLKIPRRLNDEDPPGRRSLFLGLLGDAPEPLAIRIAATLAFAPYPRIEETQVFRAHTGGGAWTVHEWVRGMLENAEHVGMPVVSTAVVRMLALTRFGLSRRELAGSISLIPGMMDQVRATSRWALEDVNMLPPVLVARVLGRLEPFLIETATAGPFGITIRYFHQTFPESLRAAPAGAPTTTMETCRGALALWFDQVAHAWLHPADPDDTTLAWRHITSADLRALRQAPALLIDIAASPDAADPLLTPRDALEKAFAQLGDVAALGIRLAAGLITEVIDDLLRIERLPPLPGMSRPAFVSPLLDTLRQQAGYMQRLTTRPDTDGGTDAHETDIMQLFSMVMSRLLNVFMAEAEDTPLHAMAMQWLRGRGRTFRWLRNMGGTPTPLRIVCSPLDILDNLACRPRDIFLRPQYPPGHGPGTEQAVMMCAIATRSSMEDYGGSDGAVFMLLDPRDGHERGRMTVNYPWVFTPPVTFHLFAMDRDGHNHERAWIGTSMSGVFTLSLLPLDHKNAAGQEAITLLSLPPDATCRRLLFNAARGMLAVETAGRYDLYGPLQPSGPDGAPVLPMHGTRDGTSIETDGDRLAYRDAEGGQTFFTYVTTLPARTPDGGIAPDHEDDKIMPRRQHDGSFKPVPPVMQDDDGSCYFALPDGASVRRLNTVDVIDYEPDPVDPDDYPCYDDPGPLYEDVIKYFLRLPGETGPGHLLVENKPSIEVEYGIQVEVVNGDTVVVIRHDDIQVIPPPYTTRPPAVPIQQYDHSYNVIIRSRDGRRDEFVVRHGYNALEGYVETCRFLSVYQLSSGQAYHVTLREPVADDVDYPGDPYATSYGLVHPGRPVQPYDGGVLILGKSGMLYDLRLDTLDQAYGSGSPIVFDGCQWLDTDRMLLVSARALQGQVVQVDEWGSFTPLDMTVKTEPDTPADEFYPGETFYLSPCQPTVGALVCSGPKENDSRDPLSCEGDQFTPLTYYDRNGKRVGRYKEDGHVFFPMEGYPVLILSDGPPVATFLPGMVGWAPGLGPVLPPSATITREGCIYLRGDKTRYDLLTGVPVGARQTLDPATTVDTAPPRHEGPHLEQMPDDQAVVSLRNGDDTLWYCGDISLLVPSDHMTQLRAVSRARLRFVDQGGRPVPLMAYCGADPDPFTMWQLGNARNRAAAGMTPPFDRATLLAWSRQRLSAQLALWMDVPDRAFDILRYLDRAHDLAQRGMTLLSAEQTDMLVRAQWYLELWNNGAADGFVRVLSLVSAPRFVQILNEIVDLIRNAGPDASTGWLNRGHELAQKLKQLDRYREMAPEIGKILGRLPPLPPAPVRRAPRHSRSPLLRAKSFARGRRNAGRPDPDME